MRILKITLLNIILNEANKWNYIKKRKKIVTELNLYQVGLSTYLDIMSRHRLNPGRFFLNFESL